MRTLKTKILWILLAIVATVCLVFVGLYLYSQYKANEIYNEQQEEYNVELAKKDLKIDSIGLVVDSLIKVNEDEKIRFGNYIASRDSIDAARRTVKKRAYEKHSNIDKSNATELSNILSGFVRE